MTPEERELLKQLYWCVCTMSHKSLGERDLVGLQRAFYAAFGAAYKSEDPETTREVEPTKVVLERLKKNAFIAFDDNLCGDNRIDYLYEAIEKLIEEELEKL